MVDHMVAQNSVAWEWVVSGNGQTVLRYLDGSACELSYADGDMNVHQG